MISRTSYVLVFADRFYVSFLTIIRQAWDVTGLLTVLVLFLLGIGWHPVWQHLPTLDIGWALILIIGVGGTAVAIWKIIPFDPESRSRPPTLDERFWKFLTYLLIASVAFILSAEITLQDSVSHALRVYIQLYATILVCVSFVRTVEWLRLVYD